MILIVLTVTVQPGRSEAYIASMQARLAEERASAGVLQFELFRSTQEPDTFVLFERFEDEPAYAAHRQRMQSRDSFAASMRAGPPMRERFDTSTI